VEAGIKDVGKRFAHIGTVPGYGGTRPRQLSLSWPDAYRSWPSQIAVSQLIQQMRDMLNNETKADGTLRYRRMPLATGERGAWTVLGVCQVLMGDGY